MITMNQQMLLVAIMLKDKPLTDEEKTFLLEATNGKEDEPEWYEEYHQELELEQYEKKDNPE